jgi:predicted O-methyltransferase YrrM
MNENVNMTINIVTTSEMTVPQWMVPYVRQLFAIPTHMTASERLMLLQTAVNLGQGFSAVEIGSYLGASTAFLGLGAQMRAGTVHAVDTWQNESMGGEGLRDTWSEFCTNTAPFASSIATHRGTSLEIAHSVALPCDLLFIDGDHHKDAVVADLQHWLPSLKPGGMLAMHDIDHGDVKAAFDEVIGTKVDGDVQVVDRLLMCRPAAR